jgi:hypothetical protein
MIELSEFLEPSFIFEVVTTIVGTIFLIYSMKFIRKITALFPGADFLKKWYLMLGFMIIFVMGFILDIVFIFFHVHEIISYMNGVLNLLSGLAVYIIISLNFKTYEAVLLRNSDTNE